MSFPVSSDFSSWLDSKLRQPLEEIENSSNSEDSDVSEEFDEFPQSGIGRTRVLSFIENSPAKNSSSRKIRRESAKKEENKKIQKQENSAEKKIIDVTTLPAKISPSPADFGLPSPLPLPDPPAPSPASQAFPPARGEKKRVRKFPSKSRRSSIEPLAADSLIALHRASDSDLIAALTGFPGPPEAARAEAPEEKENQKKSPKILSHRLRSSQFGDSSRPLVAPWLPGAQKLTLAQATQANILLDAGKLLEEGKQNRLAASSSSSSISSNSSNFPSSSVLSSSVAHSWLPFELAEFQARHAGLSWPPFEMQGDMTFYSQEAIFARDDIQYSRPIISALNKFWRILVDLQRCEFSSAEFSQPPPSRAFRIEFSVYQKFHLSVSKALYKHWDRQQAIEMSLADWKRDILRNRARMQGNSTALKIPQQNKSARSSEKSSKENSRRPSGQFSPTNASLSLASSTASLTMTSFPAAFPSSLVSASTLGRDDFYRSLFELCDLWTLTISHKEYLQFLAVLYARITQKNPLSSAEVRKRRRAARAEARRAALRNSGLSMEEIDEQLGETSSSGSDGSEENSSDSQGDEEENPQRLTGRLANPRLSQMQELTQEEISAFAEREARRLEALEASRISSSRDFSFTRPLKAENSSGAQQQPMASRRSSLVSDSLLNDAVERFAASLSPGRLAALERGKTTRKKRSNEENPTEGRAEEALASPANSLEKIQRLQQIQEAQATQKRWRQEQELDAVRRIEELILSPRASALAPPAPVPAPLPSQAPSGSRASSARRVLRPLEEIEFIEGLASEEIFQEPEEKTEKRKNQESEENTGKEENAGPAENLAAEEKVSIDSLSVEIPQDLVAPKLSEAGVAAALLSLPGHSSFGSSVLAISPLVSPLSDDERIRRRLARQERRASKRGPLEEFQTEKTTGEEKSEENPTAGESEESEEEKENSIEPSRKTATPQPPASPFSARLDGGASFLRSPGRQSLSSDNFPPAPAPRSSPAPQVFPPSEPPRKILRERKKIPTENAGALAATEKENSQQREKTEDAVKRENFTQRDRENSTENQTSAEISIRAEKTENSSTSQEIDKSAGVAKQKNKKILHKNRENPGQQEIVKSLGKFSAKSLSPAASPRAAALKRSPGTSPRPAIAIALGASEGPRSPMPALTPRSAFQLGNSENSQQKLLNAAKQAESPVAPVLARIIVMAPNGEESIAAEHNTHFVPSPTFSPPVDENPRQTLKPEESQKETTPNIQETPNGPSLPRYLYPAGERSFSVPSPLSFSSLGAVQVSRLMFDVEHKMRARRWLKYKNTEEKQQKQQSTRRSPEDQKIDSPHAHFSSPRTLQREFPAPLGLKDFEDFPEPEAGGLGKFAEAGNVEVKEKFFESEEKEENDEEEERKIEAAKKLQNFLRARRARKLKETAEQPEEIAERKIKQKAPATRILGGGFSGSVSNLLEGAPTLLASPSGNFRVVPRSGPSTRFLLEESRAAALAQPLERRAFQCSNTRTTEILGLVEEMREIVEIQEKINRQTALRLGKTGEEEKNDERPRLRLPELVQEKFSNSPALRPLFVKAVQGQRVRGRAGNSQTPHKMPAIASASPRLNEKIQRKNSRRRTWAGPALFSPPAAPFDPFFLQTMKI